MFLMVTSQNSLGMGVGFNDNGTPAACLLGGDLAMPIVLLFISGRTPRWRTRALVSSPLGPEVWPFRFCSLGKIELDRVIELLFPEPCLKLGKVSPFQPVTALLRIAIIDETAPFFRSCRVLGDGRSVAWVFITVCRISRPGNWAGFPNA